MSDLKKSSPEKSTRSFGLFILGDEILSGKRQDRHFQKVQEILSARGLSLSWAQYLGDDRDRCVRAFEASFASGDIVLSCGGIGSTPDDHTRQAAAQALGVDLTLHPEAERLIRERARDTQQEATIERLRMGEFPLGAQIIPNPYNKIPGFHIREHYFFPGFPVMAWPMMEWVLETFYRDLFRKVSEFDLSMVVYRLYEAAVTPLMQQLSEKYPSLRIYSLPSAGDDGRPRHVELGLKASAENPEQQEAPEVLRTAFEEFRQGVMTLGGEIGEERETAR